MTVNVLWLFFMVSCVSLQCVIVVFPDHTHLLFLFITFDYLFESITKIRLSNNAFENCKKSG